MFGTLRWSIVLALVLPAMADLQEAKNAWRSDDSETALAQIQPHLETVDESSRAWHELYQDIHMAQKREAELLAEYQEHLKKKKDTHTRGTLLTRTRHRKFRRPRTLA